ncbi:RidA family protein [Chromobacterium haemolyticum]|uniref:RidA family protein n=1 Tax=Chromobacterium haemolyticum TaxID=394935 RepID=UPI00244D0BB7|nr:RidA family protein [Chromobacterium haemolyticum]MDH0340682.1 RidA family protein [Chromobacterium haemolyticum]
MSNAIPFSLSNPAGLYDPAPNAYSHLAIVNSGCRMLLVAGQGGENAAGELADGFEAQVRQALANLRTALAAGGTDLAHVAKLTVLIVDHSEARLQAFGALLSAAWGALPTPTYTLIPVPRLALDGMLFEIEATAFLPA